MRTWGTSYPVIAAFAFCGGVFAGACAARPASTATTAQRPIEYHAPTSTPAKAALPWAQSTQSPQFVQPPQDLYNLAKDCPRFESGLMRSAAWLAQRQTSHTDAVGTDELKFSLRQSGEPHTGQQSWVLSAAESIDPQLAADRLQRWLISLHPRGELRCGIATAQNELGNQVIAVIAVDALAELAPLPTAARLGQWLTVNAHFLLPAAAAKVVVMGPNGTPRPIPTSSPTAGDVHASVSLDQPGPWLIQVLAQLDSGPSPALEAMVFVDSAPSEDFTEQKAAGESSAAGIADAAAALTAMANAARSEAQLMPLVRDPQLDTLATQQAQAMRAGRQVSHNLGLGGPDQRMAAIGLEATDLGEILSHAGDAISAHRVIWASPSHRAALLEPRFTSLGIGVALDEDRSIWVCELLTNFGSAGKILPPP
ncbi:MAG TPA: CAP domain-containing protein [Polyangiaceae bacterium]|nr:CAP domain-containing protein [Polyangiaceae bacterium]